MNRQGLVDDLAKDGFETKASAERALESVIGAIVRGLKKDRHLVLSGFGSFEVRAQPAAIRRNPRTGEPVRVKARRKVLFHASKLLRGAV